MDIRFDVSFHDETGGFVARWDDTSGGGACTQGESIADLETMPRDAVGGYLAEGGKPLRTQRHFVEDPMLVLAGNCRGTRTEKKLRRHYVVRALWRCVRRVHNA